MSISTAHGFSPVANCLTDTTSSSSNAPDYMSTGLVFRFIRDRGSWSGSTDQRMKFDTLCDSVQHLHLHLEQSMALANGSLIEAQHQEHGNVNIFQIYVAMIRNRLF